MGTPAASSSRTASVTMPAPWVPARLPSAAGRCSVTRAGGRILSMSSVPGVGRVRARARVFRPGQASARRGTGHSVTASRNEALLGAFLERYPPRPYCPPPGGGERPPAELEPVTADDGLWYVNRASETPPLGSPRCSMDDDGANCHLWVVDERGRPCISQAPLARLGSGKLHHTNLTGGAKRRSAARCGSGRPAACTYRAHPADIRLTRRPT